MTKVHRTGEVSLHRTPGGEAVRLSSRAWSVSLNGRRWHLALGYQGPAWVETDADRVRIVDHLALLRLLLIVVWIVATMKRLTRRSKGREGR